MRKVLYNIFYYLYFIVNTVKRIFKLDEFIFIWRYAKWKYKLMKIGKNVKFFKGVIIHSAHKVSIGSKVGVGDYVQMWGGGEIEIGNDVLIATHSVITSQGHDVNADVFWKTSVSDKVIIEDNVWLGAGVLVMPGVTIGKNSIIGAGSVVVKNIPENSIAVGAPADVIKRRKK